MKWPYARNHSGLHSTMTKVLAYDHPLSQPEIMNITLNINQRPFLMRRMNIEGSDINRLLLSFPHNFSKDYKIKKKSKNAQKDKIILETIK